MIDETLSELAKSGLLGLLLAISLFTIFYLYKETKTERDSRLSELKSYSNDDRKFIIEIKELLLNILDLLKKGKDV